MRRLAVAPLFSVFCVLLAFTGTARAETTFSGELDFAAPVDEPATDPGWGGQLRFGKRFDFELLTLDGELGVDAHALSGALDPKIYRGVVGARLGLALGLRPSVFAHLGVGHVDFAPAVRNLTNVTGDAGLALDFTLLPVMDLGAHAAYNLVAGNADDTAFGFVTLGGHLTLVLE